MEETNKALEKLYIPCVQPKPNMKAQILLANQIGYVYKKAWVAQKKMTRHWTWGWNGWFKWRWHVRSRYNTKETNEENIEELDEDEDIEGTGRQLATDDEDDVEDNDEDR